ncbi:Transposase IS4 [Popillia japonica]|uniref:Transposase IS4 n=1 Tax=Popillia japonica TaxID=7064 RepID=A0AAW1HUX7_POPJA
MTRFPETVKFYNEIKFGVEVLDQMARQYSPKSASRRWPPHVFFNILDMAAINAWILYKEVTGTKISRHDLLFELAEELMESYTT